MHDHDQDHTGHDHGHDHGAGGTNVRRSLPSLLTGLLLALVLLLYMVTYQVRFTEVAVVRTLGRIGDSGVKLQPGLYWKWPWPIQRVQTFDNRLQVTTTTGEENSTKDGKNTIVTTAVNWRIEDPRTFSLKCNDEANAENQLKSLVRNEQRRVIGSHTFSQFISNDQQELKYDDIATEIEQSVNQSAKDLYGINVASVKLVSLALPSRITENVLDAMKKERLAVAARFTSEGESVAQQIKDTADSIAATIQSFADRKATEIVAEGQRRAAEYNKVLAQDQELAKFLILIRKLPEILKDRTTIVLDAASAGFTPLLSDDKPVSATANAPTTRPAEQTASGDPLPGIVK